MKGSVADPNPLFTFTIQGGMHGKRIRDDILREKTEYGEEIVPIYEDFQILQTLSGESSDQTIPQALPAESSDRILIDFRQHFHLGWSHYRLLLSQGDPLKRKFHFDQAATQRWAVRSNVGSKAF